MINVEEQFLTGIYTPEFLIQQDEDDIYACRKYRGG